jgi:hypothetical protein
MYSLGGRPRTSIYLIHEEDEDSVDGKVLNPKKIDRARN